MQEDSPDPFIKMTIVSAGLWAIIGTVALTVWLIRLVFGLLT
jgi:hypothetical protein